MVEESKIIFYTSPEGQIKIEVFFRDETVWLTQKKMAKLFGVETNTVNYHLKEIFSSRELLEKSVIRKFRITAEDGKEYLSNFYNLDAIISVGYRVNSAKATKFRIWATSVLKEFIIKGFVLDSERLKNGSRFGKDYFEELLEKIREIRASERRFYLKVTDIYALSADYDKNASETKDFFATVQNKLHWAITGKTAAEIIYSESNAKRAFMGLKTWKNAPKGKILRSDTVVAKNYLSKEHISELEQIVSAYLDLAENMAKREILMKMKDWAGFLNNFLELSHYPVLVDKGKVSMIKAQIKAGKEYERFRIGQDKNYISDFDKEVQKLLKKENLSH